MFEDIYERKLELERVLEDDTVRMEEKRAVSQKLRAVYKALGEADPTLGEDPLIDRWERELEAGVTPDLEART